jgi:protein phosphatase
MRLTIPEISLVVMIGPSGSGKSTFARKHFKTTEVLSSDFCRGLVSDDENDQSATDDAFETLHFIAAKRLAAGRLTVIDATNVQPEARKSLVSLAREYHCLPVAIVCNLTEKVCRERNSKRPDRNFGPHVIRQQSSQLRRSLKNLGREGFRHIFILSSPEEMEEAIVERQPLWCNLKSETGPFDIIGDLHGCCDELEVLLEKLGYQISETRAGDALASGPVFRHPQGRRAVFLGDLVDRGPRILDTMRIVYSMVETGSALCVPGNHDIKLLRKLRGSNVKVTHGLEKSLAELDSLSEDLRSSLSKDIVEFLDSLVSHYLLDDGRLVVAHAGMKQSLQGRGSGRVRDFALFGETTGETDEYGLPRRYNWAMEYRGKATVVYGHTPVPEPEWLNNTINIDTGCVFGGRLTALRYPEKELVSVQASKIYCEPIRPLLTERETCTKLSAQQRHDDLLDIEDVLGKRIITTRLLHTVTVREENAVAALEVMSRFATDPKWLIYLPPTISPCETSSLPGFLEHPAEAFAYYRREGVSQVICEEKHMGSRAIVIVCRDEEVTCHRFGISGGGAGVCYTRTGRRLFEDASIEAGLLARVRTALDAADFWNQFDTDWICLDSELMPWSAKAISLLREQYAAVGAASRASLVEAVTGLQQATERGADANGLLNHFKERLEMAGRFVDAYRRYCWPVNSLDDFKLAPFQILAAEGKLYAGRDHSWHMEQITKLCIEEEFGRSILHPTSYKIVDLSDSACEREAIDWWEDLTANGGEGMVVKPVEAIVKSSRGFVQPAVKCRGREYLRIIYGPEYTREDNLARLRSRSLSTKRSLALRQFALGIEALERFVRLEPLRHVHECVFGVLALESEPVDPRL